MTAQPNPACIADVAAFLAALPLQEGQHAFGLILAAIRRDLPSRMGWSAVDTEAFAARFADALADELNAMPRERVLH
jgi:hypothetical protein